MVNGASLFPAHVTRGAIEDVRVYNEGLAWARAGREALGRLRSLNFSSLSYHQKMEGKAIAVINSHMDPLRRIIAALEQRYVFLGLAGSAHSLQRTRTRGFQDRNSESTVRCT